MAEALTLPFAFEGGEHGPTELWPNFLALAERGWPHLDVVAQEVQARKLSATYAVLTAAVRSGFVTDITFKVTDRVYLGANKSDIE